MRERERPRYGVPCRNFVTIRIGTRRYTTQTLQTRDQQLNARKRKQGKAGKKEARAQLSMTDRWVWYSVVDSCLFIISLLCFAVHLALSSVALSPLHPAGAGPVPRRGLPRRLAGRTPSSLAFSSPSSCLLYPPCPCRCRVVLCIGGAAAGCPAPAERGRAVIARRARWPHNSLS